jgi:oxygen-independent coproporphyrinogen III oxidase
MAHLYIHIPFCLSKCDYCSFVSYPGMNHLFDRYIKALEKEMRLFTSAYKRHPLDTIFFGGGTPSLLSVENISTLLQSCRERFAIKEKAEISMEVNPKTVDFMQMLALKNCGINRVSIGVQSFIDAELQCLGRIHNAQEAWDGVEAVQNAEISNFNIDLISGIPGQSVDSWCWNLQTAIALRPEHLSLYQLSVEDKTALSRQIEGGQLTLPDEEEIAGIDSVTSDLCTSAGYNRYEISNYARPGFECRHNINYWLNEEYYGIGAGAVHYLAGERVKNIEDPPTYCERMEKGESVIKESESLDSESSFRESVVMGLRMVQGVSSERLMSRYGIDLHLYYGETLQKLLELSLLEFDNHYLRLTARGLALANRVMADLV